MKLPHVERAVIAPAKITHYLLNTTHPRGGPKAVFFLQFGFSVAQWELLAEALLQHAATHTVTSTLATPEGILYVIDGALATPDGRNPAVRVVWAIDADNTVPRLITAHPLKGARRQI
ncbi:MAG: hypothetical protein R2867_21490 [Caldilineaceae bacterium]